MVSLRRFVSIIKIKETREIKYVKASR
jgi:hypothetical protein